MAVRLASARGELSFDLVIYGATPAGIMAAKRARLRGLSVCLLEPTRHVGGLGAGGISYTDQPHSGGSSIPSRESALVGGDTLQFFKDINYYYTGTAIPRWDFEPKNFERVAYKVLNALGGPNYSGMLMLRSRIDSASDVRTLTDENGNTFITHVRSREGFIGGSQFIDASYEGDLMAFSGVPYVVGRESLADFGEQDKDGKPYAGFKPASQAALTGFTPAAQAHWRLKAPITLNAGDADLRVQAFNFRTVITNRASLMMPFSQPYGYDRDEFLVTIEAIGIKSFTTFLECVADQGSIPIGNTGYSLGDRKINTNSGSFLSNDLSGWNWDYPDGRWSVRDAIIEDHATRQRAYFWYLQNGIAQHAVDLGLSGAVQTRCASIQADAANYGYCIDEFQNSEHGAGFPHALYVREARRMRGMHVLNLFDMNDPTSTYAGAPGGTPPTWPTSNNIKATPVCLWNYGRDVKGTQFNVGAGTQIFVDGYPPYNNVDYVDDYMIPAEVLIPPVGSICNLTVPVCFSSTHVAMMSSRMEPCYMELGEAAGEIAAQRFGADNIVQNYDYADLATRLTSRGSVIV